MQTPATEVAPPRDSRESGPPATPRTTLAIGSIAVFLVALELTIIALAFPDIGRAFPETPPNVLVWVFTAFNVVVAACLLPGGWLADRVGRKRTFLTGFVIFLVGSLVAGIAGTPGVLIAGRVIQAAGGGLTLPSSLALILADTPRERRDVAIGLWGAAAGIAAAVGPTLGAILVDQFGWRSVFLLNVPVGIVACALGARFLVESSDRRTRARVDLVAVPAAAGGTGAVVLAMSNGASDGWTSADALVPAGVALVLLMVFIRRTWTHPTPLIGPDLITERCFAVSGVGTLLFVAAFSGWLVIAPTFLTQVWGYSVLDAGLAITPGPLVMAAVAGPAGHAVGAVGHRTVIVAGTVLSAAALAWWLMMLDASTNYLAGMLPGLLLLGGGVGLSFPMLAGAALSRVDADEYGIAAAGNTTIRQIGMALGIALAVAIVGEQVTASDQLAPYRSSWGIDLALVAAAGLAMVLLPRATGTETTADEPTGATT